MSSNVSLPNTLVEIEDYSFKDCFSFEDVPIPNGVQAIGEGAFQNVLHISYDSEFMKANGYSWGAKSYYDANERDVIYFVGSQSHTEKIRRGTSALSPKTFTPTKSGWTFVGWREDAEPSNEVLTECIVGNTPITLQAVFKQDVNAFIYNASTTPTIVTKQKYYNSENIANPSFELSASHISGLTILGWTSDNSSFSADIANGSTISSAEDITFYSLYEAPVSLTTYNGSTSATAETKNKIVKYGTSITYSNPSFTLTENTVSGYTAAGWTTSASGYSATLANGGTVTLSDNATYYSLYYKPIVLTKYNGSTSAFTETKNQLINYHDTVTYSNPSFTLSENAMAGWTAIGWTNSTSGYSATIADGGSITLSDNATYYSLYSQAVTLTKYNGSTSPTTESKSKIVNYHSSATYSNPSFTLSEIGISGWTAAGWTTSASGYSATVVDGGTITLSSSTTYYSLYYQIITLTYYDYGYAAQTKTGTRILNYHSSATYSNPTITTPAQRAISNWVARGWSTSNTGNATISYYASTNYTFTSNVTIYSLYYRTVTVSYSANGGSGSIAASTGTAYLNASGTPVNASIALKSNTFTAPSTDKYANGWNISSPYVGYSDTTVYAQWGTYSASPFDLYSLDGTYYPTNNWSTVIYYSGGSADGSSTPHYVYYVDQYGSKDCLQFFQSSNTIAPGTGAYMGYQFSRTIDRKHCQTLSTTFIQAVSEGATYLGNVVIRINGNIVWQKSNGSSVSIPLSSYGQTITLTVEFPNDLDPYSYNSRWAMFTHFNFS